MCIRDSYTAVYDTVEEGEAALRSLVTDMVEKHGGDIDAFAQEYSGLQEGDESLKNYQQVLKALDVMSYEDIDFYQAVMRKNYFDTPQDQRRIAMERVWSDKAAQHETNATGNQVKLQAYFLDPEQNENSVHQKNSDYKNFKSAFGTKENYELVMATFGTTGNPMEAFSLLEGSEEMENLLKEVTMGGPGRINQEYFADGTRNPNYVKGSENMFDAFKLAYDNWLEESTNLSWYQNPYDDTTGMSLSLIHI